MKKEIVTFHYRTCSSCIYADNKSHNGIPISGEYKCMKKNKTLPNIWAMEEIPSWCPLEDA